MKRIMATGGKGFFASRFAERCRGNYEILPLGRKELDVTDENAVLETVRAFRPDYIVHAAAVAATAYCDAHPEIARKINVDGSANMARAAKAAGAKLLFISTEQLFNGNADAGPFKEDDAANPDTVYGKTKLEAERVVQGILDEFWIVRFTWLFGMPQRGLGMSGNIFWDTIAAILKNEKIYASPHEYRGMTYVHEMTRQIEKVFDLPYGVYHLGSENQKSRYEIVGEIFTGLGLAERMKDLLVEDREKYAKKNRDVRLDTSKAKKHGIIFSDTSAGIERCIAEYGLRLK